MKKGKTDPSQCPNCGRIWSPSMDESCSFPGSACDTGDCICGACEDGQDCPFHRTGRYAERSA